MAHLLGVDTGGTYTDAVVYDDASQRVVAKAKAPTTHDDLAIGIGAAIDAVLAEGEIAPEAIALVSLSTTLATNALVESKGRRACLVLVGFDDDALSRGGLDAATVDDELITATGGHTSHGDEAAPLDLDAIGAAVDRIAPTVDAFAVTAQFSVRNTTHETAVRDLIRDRTGLPVTCSHELSEALNGPKRAVTALLNARLVALVNELVHAAETMLAERAITAPVMVVRGDGSLVGADFVRDRPIETILSGPAASLIGAAHLTDLPDAIIADIGGTTTDIAVLHDGQPRLSPDGAMVGGHQTMVAAVLMHTHGIGGDSEVALADRAVGCQLSLGPRRVVPLARAALDAPGLVLDSLERQLAADVPGELDGMFVFPAARPPRVPDPPKAERELLERLATDGAIAADALVRSRIDLRAMARLATTGLVRMAGLTPTDAAHVLGHQHDLDQQAAALGARLFARRRDRLGQPVAPDETALAHAIVDALVARSAEALLAAAFGSDGVAREAATSALVRASFDGVARAARVDIGVAVPVIGLGAPAATYYPAVAAMLGADHIVPEDADVANAIGAAIGRVRVRRAIAVSAPRRGVFRVHAGEEPTTCYDLDEARHVAEEEARNAALDGAERAGARDIEVAIEWVERSATIEDKPYFVEGILTAVASGRPAHR